MRRTNRIILFVAAMSLAPSLAHAQGLSLVARARAVTRLTSGLRLGRAGMTFLDADGVLAGGNDTRVVVEGLLADPDVARLLDQWRLVRGTSKEAAFKESLEPSLPANQTQLFHALDALDAYAVHVLSPLSEGAAVRLSCQGKSCLANLATSLDGARVVGAPIEPALARQVEAFGRQLGIGPHEILALKAGVAGGLWTPTYVGFEEGLARLTGRGEDFVLARDGDTWAVYDTKGNLLGRDASVTVTDFMHEEYTAALGRHDVVGVRGMLHYTLGESSGALPYVRPDEIHPGLIMGVKEVYSLPLGPPAEESVALAEEGRWNYIRGRDFKPVVSPEMTPPLPQRAIYDVAGQLAAGETTETARVSFQIATVMREGNRGRMVIEMSPMWADHSHQIDVPRTHLLYREPGESVWRGESGLTLRFDEKGRLRDASLPTPSGGFHAGASD